MHELFNKLLFILALIPTGIFALGILILSIAIVYGAFTGDKEARVVVIGVSIGAWLAWSVYYLAGKL